MTQTAQEILPLPSVLDLDAIDSVRDWLLQAVEAGNVELDASGVERVATNALLMLRSAADTAKKNGFTLQIPKSSAALDAAIERLGMGEIFSGLVKDS